MSPIRPLRQLLLVAAALAVAACTDNLAPEARIESVQIVTPVPAVRAGDTLTLRAVALKADGTQLEDRVPTWSSSNVTVVEVTPAGLVRAVAPGTATLRAAVGDKFDAADVVVLPTAIASVELLTQARSFRIGDTVTFRARALSSTGQPLEGRAMTWQSSDPAVLTIDATGRLTAVAVGTATVRVTAEGVHHEVQVVVETAPVALVELSPTSLSLVEFEARAVAVTAYDSAGRVLAARTATWSTGDATIASVDATGRVVGRAVGATTLRVQVEGKSATLEVTVAQAPVGEIVISPSPIVLGTAETRQLTATVKDASGNVLAGRAVTWASDVRQVAMVSPAGLVYAVAPGYATISATSGGKTVGIGTTVTTPEADAMPFDLIYHRGAPNVVGEIFIAPTTGTGAHVRLNAGNVSRHPTPSPDGTRIAFYVSQEDLTTGQRIDDIFAVDRNGMNMRRLTSEEGYDGEPAWSPDGTRIAYRRVDNATGSSTIWIMNADGSNKQNLTGDIAATHSAGEPAWSPDGSRIAFAAPTRFTPSSTGIWSMKPDGSDKQQHTVSADGYDQGPSWSPHGTRIAFTRRFADNERDIVIVTLATGATQRLPMQWAQWSPVWSPDGLHIAFWQDIGFTGSSAVYTMRVDRSNVRLHTPVQDGVRSYDPQWIRRPAP